MGFHNYQLKPLQGYAKISGTNSSFYLSVEKRQRV